MAARTRSRLSRTAASGKANGVEDFLLGNYTAVIHLNLNEVGVDTVDCRTENFKYIV